MTADSTGESLTLRRLLTDVVGSGPKTADDLTYDQARGAATRVLDRETDPTTLGAFLLAMRWKENTPTELAGLVDTLRERATLAEPTVDPVDCGANYDGKTDTALLGVAAGAVAAAADVPVVVHSADRVPATQGQTYRHVLDELGVETDLVPADSARMVEETGVGFYYQPRFLPALHAVLDRREAMGVRTPLNTVETLVNPSNASVHLGSFFHFSFGARMADTLAESRTSAVERVLLVQGLEGYDDVRPGTTRVVEHRDGEQRDWTIETADYGMAVDRNGLNVGDVATDSAAITEGVLSGERRDDFADAVALNAALRIYAGAGAESIEEGLEVARDVLANGDARVVLESLRAFDAADD